MKKMIDNIRKYLPAVLFLVFLLFCIHYREDLSVRRILSYTPEEPVKAALLMLGLYAVKSVSFKFPKWARPYLTYVLPLIVLLIFVMGYYDKFFR